MKCIVLIPWVRRVFFGLKYICSIKFHDGFFWNLKEVFQSNLCAIKSYKSLIYLIRIPGDFLVTSSMTRSIPHAFGHTVVYSSILLASLTCSQYILRWDTNINTKNLITLLLSHVCVERDVCPTISVYCQISTLLVRKLLEVDELDAKQQ